MLKTFPMRTNGNLFPKSSALSNPHLVFHGIGFDISKIRPILERGILSANAAKRKGIDLIGNFGKPGACFNGKEDVSVSLSPHHPVSKGKKNTSFSLFSQKAISFVIDRSNISPKHGGFIDEAFVPYKVDPKQIVGVMLPEEYLDLPLETLSFQTRASGNHPKRLLNTYEFVSSLTNVQNIALQKLIDGDVPSLEKEKALNNFIVSALNEYDVRTLREVLPLVIPKDTPLFTNKGEPLTKPCSHQLVSLRC